RDPACDQQADARARRPALRARARARRRPARALRHPRSGARPRRQADRRLRLLADKARAARAQRALAGRDGLTRYRTYDRRPGGPALNKVDTRLEGPLLLEPTTHGDARGFFIET